MGRIACPTMLAATAYAIVQEMAHPSPGPSDDFAHINQVLRAGGPEAGFAYLAKRAREDKNYPLLFEIRLMQKRRELGLPLILTEPLGDLPKPKQDAYEQGTVEAAREVGALFLADGEIERAWPYFRAIGEVKPVAKALEKIASDDANDGVLQIAYFDRVAPRKGFELILEKHGICRAITCFHQYPQPEGREESAGLLVRRLCSDLAASIKRTIEQNEPGAPETDDIAQLIEGRDWLFEGSAYYIDTSHVASVVQLSPNLEDPETLRLVLGLTEYGRRLAPMYQFPGQPPFENVYEDYGAYIKTVLGIDIEEGLSHFQQKVESAGPQTAPDAAMALVNLLARLERYEEAVDVSLAYLADLDARDLSCPPVVHLCQMSGDLQRLQEIARQRGDLLSFAAAALQD
jgi:hypothetical protein